MGQHGILCEVSGEHFSDYSDKIESVVPAEEMAKHGTKFGWPPMSDVTAVTKARLETC